MSPISCEEIIRWTGAELLSGDPCAGIMLTGVSSDTRNLKAGDLFVALSGDRYDGHFFLDAAIDNGANALLIERRAAVEPDLSRLRKDILVFLTDDTRQAYQSIAAGYRQRLTGRIIAVTGSVGKTSTRRMIAACLEPVLRVHQTKENLNNEIGLSQTLLAAELKDQAIIVEMGMRQLGEIAQLSRIARPDIGVITGIGWSHIGRLGSREAIFKAKWELAEALAKEAPLILNADDPLLIEAARRSQSRALTLVCMTEAGREQIGSFPRPVASLIAHNIRPDQEQTSFTAVFADGQRRETAEVLLPYPGSHHVINALFGLAVAVALGIDLSLAAIGATRFRTVGNRQRIKKVGELTILDDSYNAAPESLESALQSLSLIASGHRKIAVLGGMMELGPYAPEMHRLIGRQVAQLDYDLLLTLGEEAEDYLIGLREVNARIPSLVCQSHDECVKRLLSFVRAGDFILVKGSRGYAMETVIEGLMAHFPRTD